jgi:hypothetical protein
MAMRIVGRACKWGESLGAHLGGPERHIQCAAAAFVKNPPVGD